MYNNKLGLLVRVTESPLFDTEQISRFLSALCKKRYRLKVLLVCLMLVSSQAYATPAQPTGLDGEILNDRVQLSWDEDPTGETAGYNVYVNNNYLDTVFDTTYSRDVESEQLLSFTVVGFSEAPVEFSVSSESIELPESLIPDDLTIPPSEPGDLSGNIVDDRVSLSWQASTDDEAVQGYNVYQDDAYLTTVFETRYSGTVTPGTSHSWYVVAFDIRNNFSERSNRLRLPDTGPVDTTIPPTVPAALNGSAVSLGDGQLSASITWTPSEDDQQVAGYNIYINGDYETTVFENSFATTISVDAFTSFSVVAFDFDDNFSAQSESLILPALSNPAALTEPPTQPAGLNGVISGNQATLSWQASTDNIGIGGYNVYQDGAYLTTVFDTQHTTPIDTSAITTFYVVAFDQNGNFSTQSDEIFLPDTGTDSFPPPTAPANLTGSIDESTNGYQVELAWSAPESELGITGYNVYRNNQYLTTVFNATHTEVVPTLGPWTYHVVAFDRLGQFSPDSNRVSLPDNQNQLPFLAGFDDRTIDAGQLWEFIVRPVDNDGGAPGLFGGRLPEGMRSTDNFDGTRTLSWQPLQPAVGDHQITFTVFDTTDPTLSVTESMIVTVKLPDDLSTIPNPGPTIDAISDYNVRTGDTVVMLVKAVDANGTVPELEILNPPDDSTFDVFPTDPRVRVLRWTTTAEDLGTTTFNFRATDADDDSLTFESSAELTIVDPSVYVRSGERLRDLADDRDFLFGYAHLLEWYQQPDADLYADTAAEEFNLLSTENSMKMGYMWPEPDRFRWEGADREIAFARENNIKVHGHPLLWYTVLPPWIINSPVDQRESIMNTFIDTVVTRYRDDVEIWDVVNEALEDDGSFRQSVWFEAMGEDYIADAFRRTDAIAPDAELLYNDYDVSFNGPKSDAMYALLQNMLDDNVPVDGVGFQMHLTTSFDRFDEVAANFQRFADLGLDIYVTELDVAMEPSASNDEQAVVFENAVATCLAQPACKAAQIWGFTDRYSWLGDRNALILDRNYQPKAAYQSLQNVLEQ